MYSEINTLQNNLNEILKDKITNLKPENLKKGVTLLGIEGTLEAGSLDGAKIFEDEKTMDDFVNTHSSELNVGDKAIVYGTKYNDITSGNIVQVLYFPKTVTLTNAVTTTKTGTIAYAEMSGFDFTISLTASECTISRSLGTTQTIAAYTSTDGINYTRTSEDDTFEFAEENQWSVTFTDTDIAKFIYNFVKIFGGLYEFQVGQSGYSFMYRPTIITKGTGASAYRAQSNLAMCQRSLDRLHDYITKIQDELHFSTNYKLVAFRIDDDHYNVYYQATKDASETNRSTYEIPLLVNSNGMYLGAGGNSNQTTANTYNIYCLSIDLSTQTHTHTKLDKTLDTEQYGPSTTKYYYYDTYQIQENDVFTFISGTTSNVTAKLTLMSGYRCNYKGYTVFDINTNSSAISLPEAKLYQLAETQLNVIPSDVLNGIFYGKNGVEEGTMPNNGALNYTPSDSVQSIPLGYTSGGTIAAADITKLNDYKSCLKLTQEILGGE